VLADRAQPQLRGPHRHRRRRDRRCLARHSVPDPHAVIDELLIKR
jgi:hypothetical protein